MKNQVTTRKAIGAVLFGISCLAICQAISTLFYLLPLPQTITSILFGLTYVLLSYFFLMFLCKNFFNYTLLECRIGKIKINYLWIVLSIALPLAVSTLLMLIPGHFVNNEKSTTEIISKIIIAIFTVGAGAGIVEEMIFRGFIMHVLEERWGKIVSIVVPSIIFGLIHTTEGMNFQDIFMLFIAGTSVGIMFSLITYESQSIWPSAIVHGTWNIIIISGILDIGVKHNVNSLYSYVITSKSVLLTGGHFGVESSSIAIAGYILIICFTIIRIHKRKKIYR